MLPMIQYQMLSGPEMKWGAIDLGPDLPMSAFTSRAPWNPARIGALALYCSDGRWGDAFDEFCHRHLQIPRYDRWAVPGGPAWLVPDDDHDSFFQAARLQLDFLVEVHELERIVLIAHHGCAYYAQRLGRSPEGCLAKQIADVRSAAATLRNWHPEIRVEPYLAMRSGSTLSFHSLDG